MGQDVNKGKYDHGISSGFVEGDVFIKGNDTVQGSAPKKGDEVAADW